MKTPEPDQKESIYLDTERIREIYKEEGGRTLPCERLRSSPTLDSPSDEEHNVSSQNEAPPNRLKFVLKLHGFVSNSPLSNVLKSYND